ncbi:hypothetical protein [uncultured Imperialibacter sp.]|uniref:hypothetical protein n=1 Tax=uncultured Imperialibacter sp. TaxID=1672639 RepID=UPI0030D8632D
MNEAGDGRVGAGTASKPGAMEPSAAGWCAWRQPTHEYTTPSGPLQDSKPCKP